MTRLGLAMVVIATWPTAAGAQSSRLTLDEAVTLALAHGRTIAMTQQAEARAREDVALARTRRLPTFTVESQVSRLLRPVEMTFPAGAFGTFPDTGPVPATDTAVTTPARVSVLMDVSVTQPLTGLMQARLGVRSSEAALAIAAEDTRAARLAVVRDVKRTYFALLQARSALDAAGARARLLTELDDLVADRVAERVALKGDGLDLQVRRADLEVVVLGWRHTIDAQTERLNHLLGRALDTPIEVVSVAELTPSLVGADPPATERPDVRQARLRVEQAELAVRHARLDAWPSADLALQSITPMNIDGAPRHIASVALRVSWQPFDWGRRARSRAAREIDVQRAMSAVDDAASAAALEINGYRRAVDEAQQRLRAATAARSASEERARVKTAQYRVRAVLLADVLDAHATLAERAAQTDAALLTLLTARANLDYALGEDLLP